MKSDGVVGFESSNPTMDGGGGKGSSGRDGCGPSTTSRKRAREPGEDETPAPAKRVSRTSPRRHDGVSGGPDAAMGTPPESFDSPLQQFLLDSCEVGEDGGGGDCALPLPLWLPSPEASSPTSRRNDGVGGGPDTAMGTARESFSSLQQFLLDFSCEVSGDGGGGDYAFPLPLLLPPPEASDGELSWTHPESLQGMAGGSKASSCWDGGCASRSPPGSGGGFSALPAACLSPLRGEGTGLGVLIPDTDIAECMATLQATPTKDFCSPKTSVPPSSPPRDLCNDAGGCGADDTGVVDVGEQEEEEEQSGGCDRGGVTARIGDLYQAAIPDLVDRAGVVDPPLARAPPLQLWRPGIVPEPALDLAFPRPRRGGAGSSDMEQKMMSAFLIARASGSERERCDGGGDRDAPLESLADVAANGDGSSWRSDWPKEDEKAFRAGVYAFRRDFGRIRESFLPHRGHAELVDFFYRRWKRDPEYSAWKNTDQLIGRRVVQRVGTNETRQGAGLGKSFDDHGMRRGWVVRKEVKDQKATFVVRFPADGSSQAMFEEVSVGVLETMLVDGSATDEERASEALDGDL